MLARFFTHSLFGAFDTQPVEETSQMKARKLKMDQPSIKNEVE